MRLGAVSYINALPFVVPLQQKFEMYLAPPKVVNQQLRLNALDCVLSSSVLACDPLLYPILDFGIASKGPILSVHLYSPVAPTLLSGKRIAVDQSSETSIALLRILCQDHWKVEVDFVDPQQPHDAWLLIGNEALANQHYPGYQTIDLASAWYEMTQLPFVFALFTAHRTPSEDLLQLFDQCLLWSALHQQEILNIAQQQTSLSSELILTYFAQITYRLGNHEKRGFQTFRQLCNV